MKKFTLPIFKIFLFCIMVLWTANSFGQVIFTSTPDSIAILNETYTYNVVTTYAPGAPTYSLQTAPSWLSINSTTGVISGTPVSMAAGGKVIVKATNTTGDYFQTYYVYISDAVVCDPNIIGYWPMDNLEGHIVPEQVNSYDANWNGPTQPEPTISTESVAGNSILFAPAHTDDEFYYVIEQDPFQFQYNDDFSVSFWFKNNPASYTTGYHGEILIGRNTSSNARWYIRWDNVTEKLEFFMQDASTDDTIAIHSTVIDDNEWHHVVATFNSVAGEQNCFMFLWVDKVSKLVQFDFYTNNFYGDGSLNFGWLYNWGQAYSGYLDEVVYYDKELTPQEITALYNKGIAHQSVCSPGNLAPIISSVPVTAGTEDIAYSYNLVYRKANTSPVVLSAPVLPNWLTFNTSTGVLSGTPGEANIGNNSVTLRLTCGSLAIDQTFNINVSNVNDLPVISSTPAEEVDEDANYSYTIAATDADAGATLNYSAPVLPAWMTFNTSTHVLSGTPTNTQVGNEASADFDVTLRVTDNTGAFVEQQFTLTVNQVNDAPVINSQNALSVVEDDAIDITLEALNVVDADNTYPDDFTILVKDGANYTHTGNTVTPSEDWNGNLTVSIELSDGEAVVSEDVTVSVTAVNDAPEITSTPASLTVTAGSNYEYWITCTDVEGQALTITVPTKPAWLNFTTNGNSGLLQGTPSNSHSGVANVVINVTDGTESDEQTFEITVNFNTGVQETTSEFVSVYPKPASDAVYFAFAEKLGNASLEIFSLNGMLIKKVNVSGFDNYKLDITDMKPNQYVYRIVSNDREQKGYIVVQ